MTAFLQFFTELPSAVLYLAAAVLITAETATILGLLLPGEATLLVVGFLCYRGHMQLSVAIPLAILAAAIGDNLGYAAGRRLGPRLRESRLGRRVPERRWAKADATLERLGGRSVALGRFIGFVRTLTPRLAGMSNLPYRQFVCWDAVGVLGYIAPAVLLGYFAGRSYATASKVLGSATSAVLILLVVIIGLVLIGRYLGRHPAPVTAFVTRVLQWPPLRFIGRYYATRFRWLSRRVGVTGALALNVLGGAALLFLVGYGLTWTVDAIIRHSGLPLVDPRIATWIATHRTPDTVNAATATLSGLRGMYLLPVLAALAIALNWRWRGRVWRTDLIGVLGSVGAFIPLLVIALATRWAGEETPRRVAGLLPNQTTVVTVALCLMAWLLSRQFRWAISVGAWTAAVVGMVLTGAARVYVGASSSSEAIASIVLGVLWVLMFVVAWQTRCHVIAEQQEAEDLEATDREAAGLEAAQLETARLDARQHDDHGDEPQIGEIGEVIVRTSAS